MARSILYFFILFYDYFTNCEYGYFNTRTIYIALWELFLTKCETFYSSMFTTLYENGKTKKIFGKKQ